MTTYRYIFADLLTNAILAELPMTGVNFTSVLNAPGTFKGSLLLSGVNASGLNVRNATIPGRSALYIDRDGIIVWGGIIWGRAWNSDTQHLELSGQEFESYFDRRRITTTQVYNATDQFTIVLNLMLGAMATANGDIGIIPPWGQTSGINVNRTYYSYELKSVLAAIQDLSKQGTGATGSYGFDFNIALSYNSDGSISKQLNCYSPMSGIRYSASDPSAPVFEFPSGNILAYDSFEDGSVTANTVYGVGAGSNEGMGLTTSSDATKLAAGWPVLQDSVSYTDVWDSTVLQKLSDGALAAVSTPPTSIRLIAAPYLDPKLGTFNIGDDIRVRITDDNFPSGLDKIYRLVALDVTPGENGPERMTLTLALTTTGQ